MLLSTTTAATATQVDLSLSGITLSDYSEIMLIYSAIPLSAGGTTLNIRVNDITSNSYYVAGTVGTSWALGQLQEPPAGYNAGKIAFNILNTVRLSAVGDVTYRYTATNAFAKGTYALDILATALTPSTFNKINVFSSSANGIAAGSKFLVYGVKK